MLAAAAVGLLALAALLVVDDATAQTLPPTEADGLFRSVSLGESYTCGITQAGNVRCWGDGVAPLYVDGDYVQLATGTTRYVCGLTTGGVVHCLSLSASWPTTLPTDGDGDLITFSSIDGQSGNRTTCGLQDGQNEQTTGIMRCWGTDAAARIESAAGTTVFSALSKGHSATCGIQAAGDDAHQPVCYGSSDVQTIPASVQQGGLSAIGAGSIYACGLLRSGQNANKVVCWGSDLHGPVSTAPPLTGSDTFKGLSVGYKHACAIKADDTVVCWGAGSSTDTGNWDYGQATVPATLAAATFSDVSAGYRHTCGILDGQGSQTAGTLHCWGAENFDTLHPNAPGVYDRGEKVRHGLRSPLPVLATSPGSVDAGRLQTCVRTADNRLRCIGHHSPYEWNDTIADFSTGTNGTCAVRADGSVRCWGHSLPGTPPANVTFSLLSHGFLHVCGVRDGQNSQTAGTVECWGGNDGGESTVPAASATETFSSVTSGSLHTCGILDGQNSQTAGLLRCWGISQAATTNPYKATLDFGQSTIPDALATATFSRLSAGDFHNCGILDGQGQPDSRDAPLLGRRRRTTVHCPRPARVRDFRGRGRWQTPHVRCPNGWRRRVLGPQQRRQRLRAG